MSAATETHVSWIVQARMPGRKWVTMHNAGGNAQLAYKSYAEWSRDKALTGSKMEYRLVKRTARITYDEIAPPVADTADEVREP